MIIVIITVFPIYSPADIHMTFFLQYVPYNIAIFFYQVLHISFLWLRQNRNKMTTISHSCANDSSTALAKSGAKKRSLIYTTILYGCSTYKMAQTE